MGGAAAGADHRGAMERIHEWANDRPTPDERLYASSLVLAFEFGDAEDPPPPPHMDADAAARLRRDFERAVAEAGVPRGRFRGRRRRRFE